jgi:hypothetical protein
MLAVALLAAVTGLNVAGHAESLSPHARAVHAAADTAAIRAEARDAALKFVLLARRSWMDSELARHGERSDRRRLANLHCHRDGSFNGREGGPAVRGNAPPTHIASWFSRFAVCPDWMLDRQWRTDEAYQPDLTLRAETRSAVVAARAMLLQQLDAAAAQLQADSWLVGQRVRFRLDGNDVAGAAAVANACQAERAWCLSLQGLVRHRLRDVVAADSLFQLAQSLRPAAQRCEFGSIRLLLAVPAREAFDARRCAERDSIARMAWWLADPLYIEPGNERRAEHFARAVLIELHFSLDHDERWDMRDKKGGDVIRAMLLRYGWPSYSYYGGQSVDASHSQWLTSDATPPYVAPEYSLGRTASLPSWSAMLDPFTVQDSDYELSAPRTTPPDIWWPYEHMRLQGGGIATMAMGQTALLRRDSAIVFAVATRLAAPEFTTRTGEAVTAALLLSPRPDSVQLVQRAPAALGQVAVLHGFIGSGPAMGAVEIPSRAGGRMAGRSRFGLVAPPALAAMAPGEIAVSEPILFDPQSLAATGESEIDNIFDHMYPAVLLEGVKKVGVYWESYGLRRGDSVDVAVEIERVMPVGGWRRIGMAFKVVSRPDETVTVRWTEPQPARSARELRLLKPTLARQLVLDISNFKEGSYHLRIAMARRGGKEVMAERFFQVLP